MLRVLFGDSDRQDDARRRELLALQSKLTERYRRSGNRGGDSAHQLRLLSWIRSLDSTFDELEQSIYCSEKFAARVTHHYVEEMDLDEEADYRRHLYFYKNAFIRVFSVLDKLGSFLDELFSLRTAQLKEKFSYFTVLRHMRDRRLHPELLHKLQAIKSQYREPLHELRLMRNHEVHAMNPELLDEEGRLRVRVNDRREQIENLQENAEMLRNGYDAVYESLYAVFQYLRKLD